MCVHVQWTFNWTCAAQIGEQSEMMSGRIPLLPSYTCSEGHGKFTVDRESIYRGNIIDCSCPTGWLVSMTIHISPFMDKLFHHWTFWDKLREARPNYDVGQDRQNVIHPPTETGNTISHMIRLNTLHTAWSVSHVISQSHDQSVTWSVNHMISQSHDQSDDRWTFTWSS